MRLFAKNATAQNLLVDAFLCCLLLSGQYQRAQIRA
jgi:hypothetical protein